MLADCQYQSYIGSQVCKCTDRIATDTAQKGYHIELHVMSYLHFTSTLMEERGTKSIFCEL